MDPRAFRESETWKLGMDLAEKVYREADRLPEHEQLGLIMEMRQSAIRIPSAIAEGHGRGTEDDRHRFCQVALGALARLESEVLLQERIYDSMHVGDIHFMIDNLRILLLRELDSYELDDASEFDIDDDFGFEQN
ncbi:MAG: four helix bundle protein [Fimbriimonadales bacterium]|nr:four helix bundle protein [Fimbriimonadales bacterium]